MSKTKEATNVTLVQTIAIEKQLDMLTLECAALSEENRNNWLSTDAAIRNLEKRLSFQSRIRNAIALVITVAVASSLTFIASNRFDQDYANAKIKSLDQFANGGNLARKVEFAELLRMADGVAESAVSKIDRASC